MAQSNCKPTCHRALLTDLPVDFSISFLKDVNISMKSRQTGFKYFSEGFFHKVVMINEGSGSGIAVSARSYRSQRKNESPHKLHLVIGSRNISDAYCSCQAGASGSCSHVVGLIIALQQWQLMGFTEVPSQLSCTSMPGQWSIPRDQKIETVDVPHLVFVPKPERRKRPLQNTLTDCREIKVQREDIEHLQSLTYCPLAYLVNNQATTVQTHLGEVPLGSGLATHAKFFEPVEQQTVGTKCGNLVFPQTPPVTMPQDYGPFAEHSQQKCQEMEEKTRDQASSSSWFDERKSRITASKFYKIVKRKTVNNAFLTSLSSPKPFSSAPTSYGIANERDAVDRYINQTGNHVHDCGLIVSPSFPFLGATPDGKVCENGSTGLLEVKCPYSARDLSIKEATALPNFCLKYENDMAALKQDHEYYYQVQGQLMTSGAPFCDFAIYTRKDFFIQRIFPNIEFMEKLLDDLSQFYFKYFQPFLHD